MSALTEEQLNALWKLGMEAVRDQLLQDSVESQILDDPAAINDMEFVYLFARREVVDTMRRGYNEPLPDQPT
jgi:hypothetical protein